MRKSALTAFPRLRDLGIATLRGLRLSGPEQQRRARVARLFNTVFAVETKSRRAELVSYYQSVHACDRTHAMLRAIEAHLPEIHEGRFTPRSVPGLSAAPQPLASSRGTADTASLPHPSRLSTG